MRTFKFRVWSKVANRFLHSYKSKGLIFGLGRSTDSEIEEFGGYDIGSCVEDKNLVVQQFTGRHDKNGNPIYEGDIVKGLFLDTDLHHWGEATAPVVWVDRVGGFNLSSDTWDRLSIEVVGNIFENENA